MRQPPEADRAGLPAHLEATGAFPNGGTTYFVARTFINGVPAAYDQQSWSWGYQILPYTDLDALWSNSNDQTVAGTGGGPLLLSHPAAARGFERRALAKSVLSPRHGRLRRQRGSQHLRR